MKGLYLLPVFFAFVLSAVQASPGDTTVVQSHTATQLSYFGNYDSPVVFADTTVTYRHINMTFTLGKYQCPGNPQYCGDWDYTVQVFLVTPSETFELGRFMTPYAGISSFPYTWQHRYNFDVTDYAQYLKGNNTIRVHYSGYSGGFTANVKFTAIEGTPSRNVIKIDKLWSGGFDYGRAVSIENQVYAKSLQMPAGAQTAEMKFNVSGHGSNPGDLCSEFCSKYYQVKLNGNLVSQTNIWRDNCGFNNLYPQTGTWIYDRANWCPGDVVASHFHPLAVAPGSSFLVDVDFQPYFHANAQSSYIVEGQVIYYGAYNYTTDAAMEAIISPNNYEGFYRSNPVCEEARIAVRNTGSAALTSLQIEYGIEGQTLYTVTKTVSIQPNERQEISLPALPEYLTVPAALQTFVVRILAANGAADGSLINNEMESRFAPMPIWPNNLVVRMATNVASFGGFSESNYRILDAAGNTVFARLNNTTSTVYSDTLTLQAGCYRLVVEDAGCDGMRWWANPGQGTGTMVVRNNATAAVLPLRGYFNGDFGCGFTTTFRVQSVLGAADDQKESLLSVFPNPADNLLKVTIKNAGAAAGNHLIELYDAVGKKVYSATTLQADHLIPVEKLPSGVYLLRYQNGSKVAQEKVVITH